MSTFAVWFLVLVFAGDRSMTSEKMPMKSSDACIAALEKVTSEPYYNRAFSSMCINSETGEVYKYKED